MFNDFYKGRRVLVTGHTGFKGSWLCEWLLKMDAVVCGYAFDPLEHEILYGQLKLGQRLAEDHRGDLSDLGALKQLIESYKPEVILHLAAQPLVRLSYKCPAVTFATNVMGTVNVLEAIRTSHIECTVVCVTTDKCYENREWLHAYREEDAMGGHDPYSASKGAAEIAIASYRRSFFQSSDRVRLASARAGNVIGGGDWAADRIVPDCFRSIRASEAVVVRNKVASRPWQHVLEPLSGYLHLAAALAQANNQEKQALASAFNFGPELDSNRTVAELVQEIIRHAGGQWQDGSDPKALHEASLLNLAIDKAHHLLQWKPVWTFEEAVSNTAKWYIEENSKTSPRDLTLQQIEAYTQQAAAKGLTWA